MRALARWGFLSTIAACNWATSALSAENTVPFPVEPDATARHCLAASGGASAVGKHFTANPKAVALAGPGEKLAEEILGSGAVPKDYLKSLETDRDRLRNDAMAFLVSAGIPTQTRNPTNESLAEVASHLEQCRAWLTARPPQLAALPTKGDALVDHCMLIAMSAQSLSAFPGNRSSQPGAQATRAARNGRDMLAEMQQTGILKGESLRARMTPPSGDLFLQGLELRMGLKLARPAPVEALDVRSLRMLNERMGRCHKALGLQMPLQ